MKPTRLTRFAVPVAIFVLAAALRLPGLDRQGPFLWDDAIHVLEGRWIVSGAKALAESAGRWVEERRTGEDRWRWAEERERIGAATQGIPLFFPRPGYSLLVALGLVATGDAPWSAVWVNAMAGVLTVAVLALVGPWALGSEAVAWASALALAVCGYHVAYSRIGFAEAPATLFATFFFLLYAAERRGTWRCRHALWIAGAVWGAACLVQDRLISSSFVLLLLEWVPGLRPESQSVGRRATRTLALVAPLLLFTIACEVPYYGGMLALKHFGEALPFPTHLERLIRHYGQGIGISGWRPENLSTYPYLFLKLCGWPLCIAFVAGIVVLWRRRGATTSTVLCWAILPLIPFSFTAAAARYACFVLPAFAIASGAGAVAIAANRRVPAILRPTAALGVILAGLFWSVPIARMTSGFPDATEALAHASFGARKHFSTQPYVSEVYLGKGGAIAAPATFEELKKGYDDGASLALADGFEFLLSERDPREAETFKAMEGTSTVTRWYPHTWGESLLFPFEYNFSFSKTMGFLARYGKESGRIRLYLLSQPLGRNE